MVIWRGSYYKRSSDNSWRQRQTGFVVRRVGNTNIIQRKGQRNRVIVTSGFKGVEIPKRNWYGPDARKSKVAFRKFSTRVRPNHPLAKKPRKSHIRKLR